MEGAPSLPQFDIPQADEQCSLLQGLCENKILPQTREALFYEDLLLIWHMLYFV